MEFDPRPWNLVAGLAVAAGCSDRTISIDGESAEDGTSQGEADTQDGGCQNDDDCPTGYYCQANGECHYTSYSDGSYWPPYEDDSYPYECFDHDDCPTLHLCESNHCTYVGSPPVCNIDFVQGIPIELADPVLAMTFADIDDDGAAELVLATHTELHVIENGSPTPTPHPREVESFVDSMVAGNFGPTPGHDVVLLQGEMLAIHHSNGLGSFDAPELIASPYPLARGMQAGEFDGEPYDDLLVWAQSAGGVFMDDSSLLDLLDGDVTSGSARTFADSHSGFSMLQSDTLYFFGIGGAQHAVMALYGDAPYLQTSFDEQEEARELGSSTIYGGVPTWTLFEIIDRPAWLQVARFGLGGILDRVRAGDLDGLDEIDEVAMVFDGATLRVIVANDCQREIPFEGHIVDIAFGDHDGDGDDELAVHSVDGSHYVSIVDIE